MGEHAAKTVLITGPASGIGWAAAQRFAAAGWRCVLVDRNGGALDRLVLGLPATAGAPHLVRVADLTQPDQIAALALGAPALDAIINNAGMSDSSNVPLAEQDAAQLARLVALNLDAPARVYAALARVLRPGARIVNVASGAGLHAIPWRGAYSPSKAGLIEQTKALARVRPELCVSALCPGFVRTELVETLIEAGRLDPARAVEKTPIGRMADPAELAEALFFLAGEGAPLSGQTLCVDGGSSVYGGSAACTPTPFAPLPLDTPLRLNVIDDTAERWAGMGRDGERECYPATLDASVLDADPGKRLAAVHAAAVRFASRHAKQASLTLLLPHEADDADWHAAGDSGAARMLVATLACEWGARALRINALAVNPQANAHTVTRLGPLVHFVAGAQAQFVTGQTWRAAD
ncbi:SDR family oxidoreductase [Paraburkholderia sp. CNPSo 3274]|uniref:SDR family oxidoreductase n=1 Tax=Paraburkholderia sp. CNPSo 3274 TaxID=2940932 RepID=UPI0020B64A7E|nr:SDR family oxidoreductase [Paraburkholderia sp. CNPSo 3274]MCP3707031.1 SDR family oxidoreductase [Paraburkholderia sp. CNPSo 3274]